MWEACGFLVVPSLTSPACPPKLSNEGTEKQAIGGCTVAAFGAPPRLWIIFLHSTCKAMQSLCSGGVCMRSIMLVFNQGRLAYTSDMKLVSMGTVDWKAKCIRIVGSMSTRCMAIPRPLLAGTPVSSIILVTTAQMQSYNASMAFSLSLMNSFGLVSYSRACQNKVEFVSSHASPAFCAGGQLLHQDFQLSHLQSA